MNKTTKKIRCYQCGRIQGDKDGLWLLCMECGTFRCTFCYGNPLDGNGCPGCADRDERRALVDCIASVRKEAIPVF